MTLQTNALITSDEIASYTYTELASHTHTHTELAFVDAMAYGIQLLEREPCNVADQYHSNHHHIAFDHLTPNCKCPTL